MTTLTLPVAAEAVRVLIEQRDQYWTMVLKELAHKLIASRDEQWRALITQQSEESTPPATEGLAEAAIAAVTAALPELIAAVRSDTIAMVERDAHGKITKVETKHK